MLLFSGFCLLFFLSFTAPPPPSAGLSPAIEYFRTGATAFGNANVKLKEAILLIRNNDPQTILNAREALKESRRRYKRIEFFLEYFFKSSSLVYNSAPKYEMEEPYMEYETPIGMQVMEGLLFDKDVESRKTDLLQEANALASSSQDLNSLLYNFTANDKQLLESLRIELIRIYTLGISGYDAPLLKSGISESFEAFSSVQYVLAPYIRLSPENAGSITFYANGALGFLKDSKDFDSFDRITFYTEYGLPFQHCLGQLITRLEADTNSTEGVLNYDAPHLFSRNAININAFPSRGYTENAALLALGKKLFNETLLSGNNKVSCATCHQPGRYFTDGIPTSLAIDGHSNIHRNAPSLLYAGFQYEQFWDGRAKSLEQQVEEVIVSSLEMNGNYANALNRLKGNPEYPALFNNAFPASDSGITISRLSGAIACFIRTLNPRNSAFDRYMEGEVTALNAAQQHGFNLFMGKAQCGTCHFAPLFNGLIPPLYRITELEVLGTPGSDDLTKPVADSDSGRFKIFPIEFYKRAFKTPTVRNVSRTGPYMHNGAFKSLEGVIEFYNRGGGNGIGLDIPTQTLSSDSLRLTKSEISDLVSFMSALEDSVLTRSYH